MRAPRRRTGFTLLEMLLASGIAVLLMAALYVAMDVQVRFAQTGREAVEQSALARALFARIAADIDGALTPITAVGTSSSAASASAAGTGGAATGTAADAGVSVLGSVTPLNMGVQGDNGQLILYVSRVPRSSSGGDVVNADAQPLGASDLRRVSWWLAAAGDGGLARQELDRVTADDDDSQPPPFVSDEARFIVAPEVAGVTFRYFDGTTWLDTWDGSQIGQDNATPVGPPRAVEIRLDIRAPGAGPDGPTQSYRHVVAVGAANAQPTAAGDMGTTTTGQ
jgi:prepilin-type N-terminal cleavage/methylation domain-containing protein